MSCAHYLLPSFCLAGALAAQSPTITHAPSVHPVESATTHGDERWLTARVVDGVTGEPLPDAELVLIAESAHPMRGEFWSSMSAKADADGFVRLRVDKQAPGFVPWNWTLVRAPGHGMRMSMEIPAGGEIVRLMPAVPVPVQLLDEHRRPIAGALLGFCSGCGHTPDLVHARTDADGVAHFADVDLYSGIADFYVEHPGRGLGYDSVRWFPGEPPARLVVGPEASLVGNVVDEHGKPAAGVYVGNHDVHRGPWTRTRADGSFALHGSPWTSALYVHDGTREVQFELPSQQPYRLELPPPNGERSQLVDLSGREPAEADDLVNLHLRVADTDGNTTRGGRCTFVGPLPETAQWTSEQADREDDFITALRPGRYRVLATSDDHEAVAGEIVVRDGGDNRFELRAQRAPAVRIELAGPWRAGDVELRSERGERDITELVRRGEPVGIPVEPFTIVVREDGFGQRREFAFDRTGAIAAKTLQLAAFPATPLRGRVVDAAGADVAASIEVLAVDGDVSGFDPGKAAKAANDANGAFEVLALDEGLAFVVVRDRAAARRPRVLDVVLPRRSERATTIDLGTIVLGAPPQAIVLDADGTPHRGAVALVRAGWHDADQPPRFPLAEGGAWQGPDLRAGDALLVASGPDEEQDEHAVVHALPVRFPIPDAQPRTLRVPGGVVHVVVKAQSGDDLRYGLTTGEHHIGARMPVKLRGLAPGRHRLWIAAENHRTAIADVDVPATGTVHVEVPLPAR